METSDLEKKIDDIFKRNKKVEADKAWEVSWTRRLVICVLTYLVALVWLVMIKEIDASLKAFVPVAGYILSTLSIPIVKKWWLGDIIDRS